MSLNYLQLLHQYQPLVTGVLHIGCQRDDFMAYKKTGVERIIYVDSEPAIFNRLFKEHGKSKKIKVLNCSLGAAIAPLNPSPKEEEAEKPQKSKLKKMLSSLADLAQLDVEVTQQQTIDTLTFQRSKYNLLKISGAESIDYVLGGATKTLKSVDYIYLNIRPGDFFTVFSENLLEGFHKLRTEENEKGETIIWLSRNPEEPPVPEVIVEDVSEPVINKGEGEQLNPEMEQAVADALLSGTKEAINDAIDNQEADTSTEPVLSEAEGLSVTEQEIHIEQAPEEIIPEPETPAAAYPVSGMQPEDEELEDLSNFTKAEMPLFEQEFIPELFNEEVTSPISVTRKIVSVPKQFCQEAGPANENDFEQWYFNNLKEGELLTRKRYYLPIMWSAYYRQHDCTKKYKPFKELQDFINSIDRTKKYYTICQYSKGILNNLGGIDIKVFASCGRQVDYPMPLLRQPHSYICNNMRDIFASFSGDITKNIIRDFIFTKFGNHPSYQFFNNDNNLAAYCYFLSRSVFALCPPGEAEQTLRIAEAMQYGAIPVLITDNVINPHNIPFSEYGVIIPVKEMEWLHVILSGISKEEIEQKQKRVVEVYAAYYTAQANKKLISVNL